MKDCPNCIHGEVCSVWNANEHADASSYKQDPFGNCSLFKPKKPKNGRNGKIACEHFHDEFELCRFCNDNQIRIIQIMHPEDTASRVSCTEPLVLFYEEC